MAVCTQIDPLYDVDHQIMLNNLVKKNWIKEGDLLVVEETKNSKINFDLMAFKLLEVKNYGITSFSFLLCCI
jgi:16S rRNA G966 N2-methylase RsmD